MNPPTCLALFLAATLAVHAATPRDDLASPDQARRDAAAKILRATYQPTPRATWEPLVALLKPGLPQSAFANLMAHQHHTCGPFLQSSDHGGIQLCRLDDAWELSAFFNNAQPPTLTIATLVTIIQGVQVDPPPTFTGLWTTYYANGQKCIEAQYRTGHLFGTLTGYRPDGVKDCLNRFDASGCTDQTYFYPSGRISSRTLYFGGFAHSISYREDGSVTRTDVQRAGPDLAPPPQMP